MSVKSVTSLLVVALLVAACVTVAPASPSPTDIAATPTASAAATPSPSASPTPEATDEPTDAPTEEPTPTAAVTAPPTDAPTDAPTEEPSAAPSPGTGDLQDALLTATDVPAGMTSPGVVEGSDFDIDQASYDEFGGEEVVSQVWQSTSGTVNAVFDFRLLFEDATSAGSYLAAAEAVLSEQVASGLTETPITDPVGENTSYYAGQSTTGGVVVDFHNFLFTVDRIAAKVFIAGQGATYEEALPIAQAAAELMAEWTGSGTDADLQQLLAHVPPAYAELCESVTGLPDGAIASVFCNLEGDVDQAQYTLFDTVASMDAAFDGVLEENEPDEDDDTGSCQTGTHASPYSIGGAPAGRLVCYESLDVTIAWTDEAINVLTFGSTTADYPELYAWWLNEAGPNR